ncbi:MAG: Ca2+-dependent phosphoinositide-specific phospholipase C [Acidimicrobiia bacterium]
MRLHRRFLLLACVTALMLGGCSSGDDDAGSDAATATTVASTVHPLDDTLRFDQVQVLASHNSYKAAPYPQVLDALRPSVPAEVAGLEYSHRPLTEQFDELGVRAIELDVWADPAGGKYAQPAFPASVGVEIPDDPAMRAPGYKVLHQNAVDTHATCATLVLCLTEVGDWSDVHPGHVPLMVQVEVKDPNAETATPVAFDALDAEIRSVFDDSQIVTPDDVRGDAETLGAAVAASGWPVLSEMRGKIVFTLDNEAMRDLYLADHPSLSGRVLFTPSEPGAADAAFAKVNDPIADSDAIRAALAANMIVRTRADADTIQARTNDTTMRDAALASGAHFVSTDYEEPNPAFSSYVVTIPGGTPARCNPVTAPADCSPTDVEDPERLR